MYAHAYTRAYTHNSSAHTYHIYICDIKDVIFCDMIRDMTQFFHTWHIHMRDVIHSRAWRASFIQNSSARTYHIYKYDMTHMYVWTTHAYTWNNSCTCVTWLIHMCDMTQSNSCTCATWLIHMFDTTQSHARHDSFTCVTWPIHTCDMTRDWLVTWIIYVWLMTWRFFFRDMTRDMTQIFHSWLIHMRDVTHSHAWRDSFIRATHTSSGVNTSIEDCVLIELSANHHLLSQLIARLTRWLGILSLYSTCIPLHSTCIPHAIHCIPHAFHMHSTCIPLHSTCIPHAFHMHSTCIPHAIHCIPLHSTTGECRNKTILVKESFFDSQVNSSRGVATR